MLYVIELRRTQFRTLFIETSMKARELRAHLRDHEIERQLDLTGWGVYEVHQIHPARVDGVIHQID